MPVYPGALPGTGNPIVDAQGRLKTVTEDPGVDRLGYLTTYTYDALDNLTQRWRAGRNDGVPTKACRASSGARHPEENP